MNKKEQKDHDSRTFQERDIDTLFESQILNSSKEDFLEVYEPLLNTIWDRLQSTLGVVTTRTLIERAQSMLLDTYPILRHLRITLKGIEFEIIRKYIGKEEDTTLQSALKELVKKIIAILVMLTGDLITPRLMNEIQALIKRLKTTIN